MRRPHHRRVGLGGTGLALVTAAVILSAAPAAASILSAAPLAVSCAPHSGTDFSGQTPSIAALNSATLTCANFAGAHLTNLDLGQGDFSGADFTGADVSGSNFVQANVTDANFSGADLQGSKFGQATMTGTILTGANATHADFSQDDLSGDDAHAANFTDADLSQATLRRANLSDANLTGATLDQADLTGANLTHAKLSGTSMDEVTGVPASAAGSTGQFPLDAMAALVTFILALVTVARRITRGPLAGRVCSGLLVVGAAAFAAWEIVAGLPWSPTSDDLFLLPFLTPVIFLGLFAGAQIRRPRPSVAAAGIALIALAGFFAIVDAGLAAIVEAFGVIPLAATCTTGGCIPGVSRGFIPIVVGAVLMIIAAILSRLRVLRPPAPDIAAYVAMQSDPRFNGRIVTTPPAAGYGAAGASGDAPENPAGQPPSQAL